MPDREYEVLILGAGPAGLQAAIHAGRRKAKTALMGRESRSSLFRAHVENFCCLPATTGEALLENGRRQATDSGAEFIEEDVLKITPDEDWFVVETESGGRIKTRSLVLAMGISRKKLNVPGEKELFGKGVSYCVECDAGFYRDQRVAVVGDESAAAGGALTMLFYASEVHLVTHGLDVTGGLADQVDQSGVVVHQAWPTAILGQGDAVTGLTLDDDSTIELDGVFIELGAKGAIELATALGVALDPESLQFVVADKKQATSVPGIWAAGDICGPPWQVAKAVGEGCVAGLEAAAYAKKFR